MQQQLPQPTQWVNQTSKQMAQNRGSQHLRTGLQEKGLSIEGCNVHILDREDKWFEGGVKEVIYGHLEHPSIIRHLPGCLVNSPLTFSPHVSHFSHDKYRTQTGRSDLHCLIAGKMQQV